MATIETDDPLDISLVDAPNADEEPSPAVEPEIPLLEYRPKGSAKLPPPNLPTKSPDSDESLQALLWIARKLCFAIGLSLFAAGLGDSLGDSLGTDRVSGPSMMGFGAFLAGVAIPLSRSKS
jgi:hypothetical protein